MLSGQAAPETFGLVAAGVKAGFTELCWRRADASELLKHFPPLKL